MAHRRKARRTVLAVLIALAAFMGLATPAHASVVDPPGYLHLKVTNPIGTCVDANYDVAGTPLKMWRCLNTDFEEWEPVHVPVPGDRYGHCGCTMATMFVNKAMDMCMAVQNNTDTRPVGTPVVQQPCDEFDEKQWWVLQDREDEGAGIEGIHLYAFTVNTKALDVQGAHTANGTPLQVHPANETDAQLWALPTNVT